MSNFIDKLITSLILSIIGFFVLCFCIILYVVICYIVKDMAIIIIIGLFILTFILLTLEDVIKKYAKTKTKYVR